MKKITYVINRIFKMDYKSFFSVIKKISKKTKKPKIIIFLDIVFCGLYYGAGYNDYYCFEMNKLNHKQRKTILTRSKNNKYVAMFNPKKYWHTYDNKYEFNKMFEKYLGREYLYIKNNEEKFEKFIKKHQEVIAKPLDDSGGHGIEKLNIKDFYNPKEMFNYLKRKELLIIEEIIKQHEDLNKVYKGSVNTLRIITLNYNDKIHFITSFLRIGNNGFVDNSCSGGMLTMIDLDKGITLYPAYDFELKVFKKHPVTNYLIENIKIPYFKEAKELCEIMAKKYPYLKYVAWDIAITNNGPIVVEGNPYPGYYYQFYMHSKDHIGADNKFKRILSGKEVNEKKKK